MIIPYLQAEDIAKLVAARNPSQAGGLLFKFVRRVEEPLLAIYEAGIQQNLMDEFDKGNDSIAFSSSGRACGSIVLLCQN